MESLWDRVRKNLVDWYEVAYEKTDEMARIGKKKIEMSGINRTIEKQLSELGGRVFDLIAVEKVGGKIAQDKKVKVLITELKKLEKDLKAKEDEIETIKKHQESEAEGEE